MRSYVFGAVLGVGTILATLALTSSAQAGGGLVAYPPPVYGGPVSAYYPPAGTFYPGTGYYRPGVSFNFSYSSPGYYRGYYPTYPRYYAPSYCPPAPIVPYRPYYGSGYYGY